MSGPGEKGHSGRPGPKNPEFASSASFGGDDKAPHPSGAMKRGVRANTESAPPSAPAGMDGEPSFVDQWIMGAHLRPAAGGQPRNPNPKRKVDYFASVPAAGRVVPDSWEEEVLPGAPDVGSQGMPRTDEVATDTTDDGAVAKGQPAIPPPEDMGVDSPPAGASPRLLRIKKKPKPGFVAPASATAATAGSDARPSSPPITKKHAFQHVEMVRADLKGSYRTRSTEEDIDSVRYFQPADPTATPTEGATQRGSTQRGSTPKFTQTEALKVHGVMLDDLRLPPGASTGNTAATESALGYPRERHRAPRLA